jgi:hypothetical protein
LLFLKDGKCGIYAARPRTCRLYPFFVAPANDGSRLLWYLCTERPEHFGKGNITPREWQRKHLSREEESILLAEFEAGKELGELMRQVPEQNLTRATTHTLLYCYCFLTWEDVLRSTKETSRSEGRLIVLTRIKAPLLVISVHRQCGDIPLSNSEQLYCVEFSLMPDQRCQTGL